MYKLTDDDRRKGTISRLRKTAEQCKLRAFRSRWEKSGSLERYWLDKARVAEARIKALQEPLTVTHNTE